MEEIHALYINLDEHTQRKTKIENHLINMKIVPHRIKAIESGNVINQYRYKTSSGYRVTTNRENNIVASHTCAILYAYEKKYEYVIILEDDNFFRLPNIDIHKIIKHAPNDWNIIKLHNSNVHIAHNDMKELRNNGLHYKKVKDGINEYSAGAYIINRRGIEEFIRRYKKKNEFIFYHRIAAVSESILFSLPNVYTFRIPIIYTMDGVDGYSRSNIAIATNRITTMFISNNRLLYRSLLSRYLKT
jgi:GR25 family glycosyltransferase involved in LPS biosynthesis